MSKISCDIDVVIEYLQKQKTNGYKTVEVIDYDRANGWFSLNPTIQFIYNKLEPTVLGIDARKNKTN